MLLGQRVTVHTDHKNLIHPSTKLSSSQFLCQQLTLEEYGVTLKYIKSTKNVIANALPRLPFTDTDDHKGKFKLFEEPPAPLINLRRIRENQEACTDLARIWTLPHYHNYIQNRDTQGVSPMYYDHLWHSKGIFWIFLPPKFKPNSSGCTMKYYPTWASRAWYLPSATTFLAGLDKRNERRGYTLQTLSKVQYYRYPKIWEATYWQPFLLRTLGQRPRWPH